MFGSVWYLYARAVAAALATKVWMCKLYAQSRFFPGIRTSTRGRAAGGERYSEGGFP